MRGVIYARYSEGPRQTDQSIEGQVDDCKAYADAHDISIIQVYADRHVSGKSVSGRDEFQRMMIDAEDHRFDCIIVWKIDRFGRSREDIALNKVRLKKAGVKLFYAKEDIPDTPEGILLESLMEGLAEYYSADLRQKVVRGHIESAKKGKFTVGRLPYGYKKDPDQHIILDEEMAPVIQEVFRMYISDASLADIRQYLFDHGITGSHGSLPAKSVVYRMVRNERYLGKFDFHGVPIPAPQIIDEETFRKAQERAEDSKSGGGCAKAKVTYLLSCKCFCGYCDKMLNGTCGTSKQGTVYHYYKCPHCKKLKPIPQEALENAVIDRTIEDVLSDEMIEKIADRIMELQKKQNNTIQIESLKKRIADLKKKESNLVDAIAVSGNAALTSRLDDYTHQREVLEDELSQLELERPTIPRELIVKWMQSFRAGDVTDPEVRRKIARHFIAAVVVTNEEIDVVYNCSEKNGIKNARDARDIAGSVRTSKVEPEERQTNLLFSDRFIILRIPA